VSGYGINTELHLPTNVPQIGPAIAKTVIDRFGLPSSGGVKRLLT